MTLLNNLKLYALIILVFINSPIFSQPIKNDRHWFLLTSDTYTKYTINENSELNDFDNDSNKVINGHSQFFMIHPVNFYQYDTIINESVFNGLINNLKYQDSVITFGANFKFKTEFWEIDDPKILLANKINVIVNLKSKYIQIMYQINNETSCKTIINQYDLQEIKCFQNLSSNDFKKYRKSRNSIFKK
jgi:hypothetical protein